MSAGQLNCARRFSLIFKRRIKMSDRCECKYKEPDSRFWLYVMVFWIFMDCNGCGITSKLKTIEAKIDRIEQKVQALNVTGAIITHNTNSPSLKLTPVILEK
jgi:hypothetical protein